MEKEQTIGEVRIYDHGAKLVTFCGSEGDWYVWDGSRRLATYETREELEIAYAASNNTSGAYGCAQLRLCVAIE